MLELRFNRIWKQWPKKTNKPSAKKAFEVLSRTEEIDWDKFEECVEAYVLLQDRRFVHDLGNWIRNDLWKDLYTSDLKALIERERRFKKLAENIVAKWNEQRLDWWLEIKDIESRTQLVREKLEERFFRENWNQALEWACVLFKRRRTGWSEHITPSIGWFCRGDTVAKIVEGEFGFPPTIKKPRPKTKQVGYYEVTNTPSAEEVQDIKQLINKFKTKLKIEKEFGD